MVVVKKVPALVLLVIIAGPQLQACAPAVVAGAGTGAVVAHDKRTVGAFIDDATIETRAKSRVLNEKNLEDAHINVTSINGVVLITGEVPSEQARTMALEKIRGINGVRRTVNEMRVAPATTFGSRTKDTWLTGKVKTALIANERLDSTRIKVVTENKVVYLMGLITQSEGQSAADSARKVKGVTRVVKLFEYTD